jgi:class 3 adenylate cyclase/tetratricopeptide (TPR) repeat protein
MFLLRDAERRRPRGVSSHRSRRCRGPASHTTTDAASLLGRLYEKGQNEAVSTDDDVGGRVRCSRCGDENSRRSRFCSNCGAPLQGARAGREERKLVSVLFVDLVGFTSRSDRADPEDVRDALRLYHAEAKQRIEQHGGIVEKFAGDAVMAVFGAPVAHGDDAERAVRAGLAVLKAIDDLNRAHGLDLSARAAANTGDAVVGVDGDSVGEAVAIGDVVNTASRLQSAAPAGRLIVAEDTYRATRHAIGYESLESIRARGKAQLLPVWLALEPLVGPAERPIAANPFVGRDSELELLRSLWRRTLTERRPHLVTLLGPPGIGKSRLCQEVSAFAATDAGRVLRGRCLPYGAQTGYHAFPQIVRAATGILESDSLDVAREKLQHAVEGLLPAAEAVDTSRYLALLLGIGVGDTVDEPRLLFFAARRFVEALSVASPVLLLFEDIHWAKASELDLLEYLATYVREAPLMFIAPARPELFDSRATWGSGPVAHTMISLDPLGASDAAVLASHLIGSLAERSSDVNRLVEAAEGNPLFLEELAASIAEVGDGGVLPVTVREAIASRIDAIPAEPRAILLSAAVIGKTFWRSVLRAIVGAADVDEALSILEARDLVHREATSQLAGDVEFTFKHMLIHEVAYSTVPRATRREGHAAVARYVEDTIEGSGETLAWVLAYHWREARDNSRAIPYLLAAAEAAFRGWAQEAVADLYSTALELAEDEALRRLIRLKRGLALVRLEDYDTAADELGELLPELEGAERLDALLARGRATLWTERDAETIKISAEAVALATELGDKEGLPAARALQSQAYGMRGAEGDLDRALELGERALAEWMPGTREYDHTEHLHLHADTTYWAGRYERCAELSQEARALAADIHSPEAVLRGGGTEALALAGLGRHEEAIRIWDELFVIARELGRNARVLLNYSSLAYRELLDLDEARRRSEEALELSAGQSFGMPRRFAQSDLIFTDLLAGDVESAQAAWPELWTDAESATGWTRWLIYGRLTAARAEIALRANNAESAVDWARRSIELARRTRRRKYEARSLSALGEALARLGRRDEALHQLQAGVAVADELVGPPARWEARAALGRATYALGDDHRAATAYAEAAQLVETFALSLAPERASRLLQASSVNEILSLAGRTRSGSPRASGLGV